ncbi:MAG: cytochrome c [Gemmatimonadetes bacterium]|nr:cytochrome c [Gemmatimonadota bacterium]
MKRMMVAGALLLALAACGDPETEDRRGYTKAPLENPAVLVGAEEASEMASLGRPDRPRPPHSIELPDAAGEAGGDAGQEVTLAPGATQEQFDEGRQLFSGQAGCQACHGPDATGTQLAPDLTDAEWLHVSGPDIAEIGRVISAGVPQPAEYPAPMPPMGGASLNEQQVQALAAYVASLGQS